MNKELMLIVVSEVKKNKPGGFNAFDCMRYHNKKYSIIDYHEYSNFLDFLMILGFIHCTGHNNSGMAIYDY